MDISNRDIAAGQLTLTPGWNVSGQVVWDTAPSLEKGNRDILVRSVSTTFVTAMEGRVAANDTFPLRGLPAAT